MPVVPVIDGPLFSYFGAKWTLGAKYPGPLHRTIVEPFAGSACYALRHAERDVVLVERDPVVASIWRYLIGVSCSEVLSLPDIAPDEDLDALHVAPEARALIAFCVSRAQRYAVHRPSSWYRAFPEKFWPGVFRPRIARAVDRIRHWRVIEGDYREAPPIIATWFVDPPYQIAGRCYRHGADDLDFDALAEWCRSRRGQTIVCENVGATWLPFRSFAERDSLSTRTGTNGRRSREAVWFGGDGQLALEGVDVERVRAAIQRAELKRRA